MEEAPNLLPSPANVGPAAVFCLFVVIIGIFVLIVVRKISLNLHRLWKSCWSKSSSSSIKATFIEVETPFIEVKENSAAIFLLYEPDGSLEYINGVLKTVPKSRLTYEDALTYLEHKALLTTIPYLNFSNVYTQEHMEHVKTILRSCTHFKEVGFANYKSPMNQQIINLLKKKAIEVENSNISVSFTKEFEAGESELGIIVESNGFSIECQIIDPKRIGYPQFLNFLKEISNQNKMVHIQLLGVKFKKLFVKLGWQYEAHIKDDLTTGIASNVRLMNDTNVYCLEYWIHAFNRILQCTEQSGH